MNSSNLMWFAILQLSLATALAICQNLGINPWYGVYAALFLVAALVVVMLIVDALIRFAAERSGINALTITGINPTF